MIFAWFDQREKKWMAVVEDPALSMWHAFASLESDLTMDMLIASSDVSDAEGSASKSLSPMMLRVR